MKLKVLLVTAIMLMVSISFAGCNSDDSSSDSKATSSNSESTEIEGYAILEDDSKAIEVRKINDDKLMNLFSSAYNPQISKEKQTVDVVKKAGKIAEIRKAGDVYYCVYQNEDNNGRYYVFFKNNKVVLDTVGTACFKTQFDTDVFDNIVVGETTQEEISEWDNFLLYSTIGTKLDKIYDIDEVITTTAQITKDGYVEIDYKQSGDNMVVSKVTKIDNELIKAINPLDLPVTDSEDQE